MGTWFLSITLLILGTCGLVESLREKMKPLLGRAASLTAEQRLHGHLFRLEETLRAGVLPGEDQWEHLKVFFPSPWALATVTLVRSVRQSGGALVPILVRIRGALGTYLETRAMAREAIALPLALATLGLVVVTGLGGGLYTMLEDLREDPFFWSLLVVVSLSLGVWGIRWTFLLMDRSVWGGLSTEEKPWVPFSLCGAELLRGLVSTGMAQDSAWNAVCAWILGRDGQLALHWTGSTWDAGSWEPGGRGKSIRETITDFPGTLRTILHCSLMEGTGCLDRIDSQIGQFELQVRALIREQVRTAGLRALKPLFLTLFPSVFLLLGGAVWTVLGKQGL